MMGGGQAPTPPDPSKVSADQFGSNVGTAVAQSILGNTNQVTPQGSLTYQQSGGQMVNGQWVPSWTAVQKLSPEQQAIYDKTTGLQSKALDLGPQALTNVGTSLNTPLSDPAKLRDDAYKALTARSTQALDLQQKQQGTQLANQGISAGTEAYDNAMRPIEQARVDASNQGVINAGNVASQNLSQQQTIHNQPLQDYATLLGFGGGVTSPSYAPASAGTVAPTDVSGNYYNSYNGKLQQYGIQQGQNNALLGGLFGLGGAAAGLGGLYGAKKLFG